MFSCGAGMYGQLGHGNNSNEILPRQIMELMGSTVTQVYYRNSIVCILIFLYYIEHFVLRLLVAKDTPWH